jgi:hypothetical protein
MPGVSMLGSSQSGFPFQECFRKKDYLWMAFAGIRLQRCLRIDGFPSWSWSGWHSKPKWEGIYYEKDIYENFQLSDGIELRVKLCDGRFMFWKEAHPILQAHRAQTQLSIFLRISAWTTRILISADHDNLAEHLTAVKHAERADDACYFQAHVLLRSGEHVNIH